MNDSLSTTCLNEKFACKCKSECKKCYTLNNSDQIIQYIPLSSKYKSKSIIILGFFDIITNSLQFDMDIYIGKHCNEKRFFHQFDFDSVSLGKLIDSIVDVYGYFILNFSFFYKKPNFKIKNYQNQELN